ncbi:MAG: LamG-like jellyroll fold domain-containing protein, partial [Bacteroidota bacterium]
LPNPDPYAATTDVTDGMWHHLAVTYRTGEAKLYVDGLLEGTYATPPGQINGNPTSTVWMGMRNDKPNERQFKGYLDNVQAYLQPLTANQVAALASEAAAPQGCTAPASSLVGYWPMDDCYQANITNTVGAMWTGTKAGGVYNAEGFVNQAAYFDGDQDRIDLTDSAYALGGQDGISYSLWVYPTLATGNREVIIRRVEPAGASVGVFLTNLTPEIYLGGLAGAQYYLADSTLPIDTWSHLGVTYGDGSLRVYRNGDLILSQDNLIGSLNFSPSGKHFLGGNPNGSRSFSGRIDEVRIFNEALISSTMATEATRVSSSPAACNNLPEGIWLFDDCASATAVDSLGNHGGTVVGATRAAGYRGAGMSFDGANDYISLGSGAGLNLTDAFTISMWVNTTQTTRGTLLIKNPQGGNFSYAVQLDNGVPLLALGNGVSNPGPFSAATNVADGTWNHLAWTLERGTVTTYVNGVAQSSTTGVTGSVLPNPGSEVWLGWRNNFKPGRAYQGLMDEVRIWQNALDATEIANLASASQNSTTCAGARTAWETDLSTLAPVFEVYPNPNQGTFTVRVATGTSQLLSVTNLVGQQVYQQQLNPTSAEHTVQLEYLKPGIYLVRLQAGDRQYQKRLVIE